MRLCFNKALALAVLFGLPWGPAWGQGHLDLGSTVPALTGIGLSGSPLSLDDYRGKWVYLDFWASWCVPCIQDLPDVVKLQQRLGGQGNFDVFSVSLDTEKTADALHEVWQDFQINYPVVFDDRGGANPNIRPWKVRQIPSTFLIDPKGVVVARDLKPQDVYNWIKVYDQPKFRTIRLESKETLLPSSPTSGNRSLRDLQINIEFKDEGPSISRYQVYINTTCGNLSAGPEHADVLYDLRIASIVRDGKKQYSVDIRKTSGTNYYTGLSDQVVGGSPIPDMAVVIDPEHTIYQFIIPVPACSSQVSYAVALYDDQINDFVRNGMTTLDTGSGY